MRGKSTTYAQAGVDINAGEELVNAIKPSVKETKRKGSVGNIGGFAGLFDLKETGYEDPLLVAATDGVGTKLKLAIEAGEHKNIGIDLVAMCVNDLVVQGAEPLFFLDYYACGKLDVEQGKEIIEGIAKGCMEAGCALIGGETAEMPGMYKDEDYDLAGFAVGAVERNELLPKDNIKKGDVLLGLESSGIHSNGYSLVRHIIKENKIDIHAPAPFDENKTLKDYLLQPTQIYVKNILNLQKSSGNIKAMAHITGGGLSENLPRILPQNLQAEITLSTWTPNMIFGWLKRFGEIDDSEMLKTFNCGIGMVIVVAESESNKLYSALTKMGESVIRIGSLIENKNRQKYPVYAEKIKWP